LKVTQPSTLPQTAIPLAAVQWAADGSAQVRWRATTADAPQMKPIRIARAGQGDVLVRGALVGEVWQPGNTRANTHAASGLKRMFGLEE
jgi:hypothetical protein